MEQWWDKAIFYHIYPLGLLDAEPENAGTGDPQHRLAGLKPWLRHIAALGVNALYIGPVFESSRHGYDTIDYFAIDRRLGTNEDFAEVCREAQSLGIRVVVDAVFNHVGERHPFFRDVLERREASPYTGWFSGVDFSTHGPHGLPFKYEGWRDNYDLVKLNLKNPEVREHIFAAVDRWIQDFGIEGLRLDAADCLDADFMRELSRHCKNKNPNFWLMGEVIHGDYNQWMVGSELDSVTNYECWKGLHSSLNDANYFEIAYALKRQFGPNGLYKGKLLYNFLENHDVSRVASLLKKPAHLYPLYLLLFTMPGIPSLYYGGEFGLLGLRTETNDRPLRPALDLGVAQREAPQADLAAAIRRFSALRASSAALQAGDYREISVSHKGLAFARAASGLRAIVALNASDEWLEIPLEQSDANAQYLDKLNGETIQVPAGKPKLKVPPNWGRVLYRA